MKALEENEVVTESPIRIFKNYNPYIFSRINCHTNGR